MNKEISYQQLLFRKGHVMHGVVLRDLRSRFFNHGLGFLIVPLFPIAHLAVLLFIYSIGARNAPFGDDLYQFFATGLLPTLTFVYISRFMGISSLQNQNMLSFPVVNLIDIVIARAFLEFVGAVLAIVAIVLLLLFLGSDPMPHQPFEAAMAMLSIVFLAIGCGMIVSVITLFAHVFMTFWVLTTILIYITSGTLFVPAYMPEIIVYFLSWNPVLHGVEWIRISFYLGYPDQVLDKGYLFKCIFLSIFVGLLLERWTRKFITH